MILTIFRLKKTLTGYEVGKSRIQILLGLKEFSEDMITYQPHSNFFGRFIGMYVIKSSEKPFKPHGI